MPTTIETRGATLDFTSSEQGRPLVTQLFVDPSAATRVVARYIDSFYNPERLHSTGGNVSPIEFELCSVLHQEAA